MKCHFLFSFYLSVCMYEYKYLMTVKLEETLGLEFQKYSDTKMCALCLICIMKLLVSLA